MSMRINTNTSSGLALYNLQNVSDSVSTSVQRLSSGLRINSGSDDPAGLIISEGLQTQVDGLTQASANAQDANNLLKTAEGGLSEVNSLLRSVRTLAVHAANTGVNDASAAQADQTQISSALDSINRIATQTVFGTKHLLDGTAGVSANVTNATKAAGVYLTGNFGGYQTQAGDVTVTVTQAATRASATLSTANASYGATVVANAGTIVLNGQSINVASGDTAQKVIDKINAVSSVTHVSAGFSGTSVVLSQDQYGGGNSISYAETASILNGGSTSTASGTSALATVTAMVYKDGVNQAFSASFTGSATSGGNGLMVQDNYGNNVLLTEAGATVGTNTAAVVAKAAGTNMQFQIGSFAGQSVSMGLMNTQSHQLGQSVVAGKSLKDLDVTTAAGAAEAIKIVDAAISQVSTQRAQIGAFQKNTLDSTVRFLGVGIQNLSASVSQIRDTDIAAEVVKMTKNQILQQAGTSVLRQANSSPQQVLSLLG